MSADSLCFGHAFTAAGAGNELRFAAGTLSKTAGSFPSSCIPSADLGIERFIGD